MTEIAVYPRPHTFCKFSPFGFSKQWRLNPFHEGHDPTVFSTLLGGQLSHLRFQVWISAWEDRKPDWIRALKAWIPILLFQTYFRIKSFRRK